MTTQRKFILAALFAAVGLILAAPAGATGKYADASGDNGSAPDVTGVTVSSDKTSGQVILDQRQEPVLLG